MQKLQVLMAQLVGTIEGMRIDRVTMLPGGDGGDTTAKRAVRFVEELKGRRRRPPGDGGAHHGRNRSSAAARRDHPPGQSAALEAITAPFRRGGDAAAADRAPIVTRSQRSSTRRGVVESHPPNELTLEALAASRRKRALKRDIAAELGEFEKKMRERRGTDRRP